MSATAVAAPRKIGGKMKAGAGYHCTGPGGIAYMCGPDDPRYTGPKKSQFLLIMHIHQTH